MNLKTLFLSLLALFTSTVTYSQPAEYELVDKYARETPGSKAQSIEKLAAHLTEKFDSETEKVRSIYVWMTDNIRYNPQAIAPKNNMSIQERIRKEQPARVLKSKRAVCEGYSNLFKALCTEAGIASEIVTGITKLEKGQLAPTGHAWNVVRVDGQWRPVDVTWGAGGLTDRQKRFVKNFKEDFFLGKTEYFIQDHFPHDPLFQLFRNPVAFDDFKGNNTVTIPDQLTEKAAFPNVTDSIELHHSLAEEDKSLSSCRRTLRFDPENGYANFTVAHFHFERALAIWNDYQGESKKVFETKTPLTREMVSSWRNKVDVFNQELNKADQLLSKIGSRDPVYSAKKQAASSIRESRKLDRIAEKQFSEYERYFRMTGG